MKLLYKPFAMVAGIIGQRAGHGAFDAVWARVGVEAEPRSPRAGRTGLVQVAGTAALEAATIAAAAAVFDQLAARVFYHLFGTWPEKPPARTTIESAASEPAAATEPAA